MAQEVYFDDKEIRRFMERVAKMVKEPERQAGIVGAISAVVFKDVIEHFEQERGPSGPWEPWSEIYREHMKEIGRSGNKILQFSGRLRQSFQPTKYKVEPHAITWFNNAKTKGGYPYAWGHDEGDGNLPERSFMWLSSKAHETVAETILAKILEDKNG